MTNRDGELKIYCNTCGERLVLFTSTNKKYCINCLEWYNWELDDNQKPIFNSSRGDRK